MIDKRMEENVKDIIEKKSILECEIKNLSLEKEKLIKETNLLKYGRKSFNGSLDKNYLEQLSNSMMALSFPSLRFVNKNDLIDIIIVRDSLLCDKIEQFNSSLNNASKKTFQALRTENNELRTLLMNDSSLFKENEKLKKKIESSERRLKINSGLAKKNFLKRNTYILYLKKKLKDNNIRYDNMREE